MADMLNTKRIKEYLAAIGLTRDAVAVYLYILKSKKPQTMAQLADKLINFPSANYRLAYELRDMGLINKHAGRPMSFSANPINAGLESSYEKFNKSLKTLLTQAGRNSHKTTQDHVELIVGRQALYDRYEELASNAKTEILVYAIGIAYSKSLYSSQKSAVKRGVFIQHAVQRLKADNYHIINKWQKLGIKLRHAPGDKGFHFMVFDCKQVLLSFSDPENTDNRLSILTDNKTVASLMVSQFQTLWMSAKEIEA